MLFSFLCDSDNENLLFVRFRILADILVLFPPTDTHYQQREPFLCMHVLGPEGKHPSQKQPSLMHDFDEPL